MQLGEGGSFSEGRAGAVKKIGEAAKKATKRDN